jgi:hypothetical protein
MYWAVINASTGTYQAQIWRNFNGTWTQLFSQNVASGNGTLRFEVVGSSLKLFQNNNLVAYASDSLATGVAGGTVGMRSSAGATFDNFSADVLTLTNNTLPFSDNFSTATNRQLSNSWLNQQGSFQVAGGVAAGLGSLNVATVNGINNSNVFVQADVTLTGAGQSAGVVSRYSGTGDTNMFWAGLINSGGQYFAQIWVNLGGTWGNWTSQNVGAASGTLRLETVGSSLKLFFNNNLVGYANDSRLTGGTVGMRASAGATIANFSADVLALNNPGLPFSDNFTTATNQQLSNDWLNQQGNFQVAGGVATGLGSLNVATVNGVSVLNSTLQALVTVAPGQAAGLVSRYSGPGDTNMYWAALVGTGSGTASAQFWVNVNGTWALLMSQSVTTSSATLKLVTSGNQMTMYVNNVSILSIMNSSIASPGTVGIRATQGATIDNFSAISP